MLRAYDTAAFDTTTARLPSNIDASPVYRGILVMMAERSPTFRRQLARIADASHLHVRVDTLPGIVAGRHRARTEFVRVSGTQALAMIRIALSDDTVELLAHEIEHVIEQLDGIDLSALSRRDGTGVRRGEDGSFETARAIHAGREVARETRARR